MVRHHHVHRPRRRVVAPVALRLHLVRAHHVIATILKTHAAKTTMRRVNVKVVTRAMLRMQVTRLIHDRVLPHVLVITAAMERANLNLVLHARAVATLKNDFVLKDWRCANEKITTRLTPRSARMFLTVHPTLVRVATTTRTLLRAVHPARVEAHRTIHIRNPHRHRLHVPHRLLRLPRLALRLADTTVRDTARDAVDIVAHTRAHRALAPLAHPRPRLHRVPVPARAPHPRRVHAHRALAPRRRVHLRRQALRHAQARHRALRHAQARRQAVGVRRRRVLAHAPRLPVAPAPAHVRHHHRRPAHAHPRQVPRVVVDVLADSSIAKAGASGK
jgi:hypothetical protein